MDGFDRSMNNLLGQLIPAVLSQQNQFEEQLGGLMGQLSELAQLGMAVEQQKQQEQIRMVQQQIEQTKIAQQRQIQQNQLHIKQEAQELERQKNLQAQQLKRQEEQINQQKKFVRPEHVDPPPPVKKTKPKMITDFYDDD